MANPAVNNFGRLQTTNEDGSLVDIRNVDMISGYMTLKDNLTSYGTTIKTGIYGGEETL